MNTIKLDDTQKGAVIDSLISDLPSKQKISA